MTTVVKGIVAKLLARLDKNNLFTGINQFEKRLLLGVTPPGGFGPGLVIFDPVSRASKQQVAMDAGLYIAYSSSVEGNALGIGVNIYRNFGTDPVIGGQFSAFGDNPSFGGSTFGVVAEAWNVPSTARHLNALRAVIVSQTSATSNAKTGLNIVFADRPDGTPNTVNGISTNAYNWNAAAIRIDSQAPSTNGEYCGWRAGIHFAEYSLDRDIDGTAIGIDFASLHYLGTPDPLLAYKMTAAIRMAPWQSILWNADASLPGNPTDPGSPVRTYYDSTVGWLRTTNTGVNVHSISAITGDVFMPDDAYLCLSDRGTSGPRLRYLSSDGDNVTISNAVLVPSNGISYPTALRQTTVGGAGAAAALPGAPLGYIKLYLGGAGTPIVIPYWAAS